LFEALDDGEDQFENLDQQFLIRGEAVGGEDSGVQGGWRKNVPPLRRSLL
jgi:hypothetical protein